MWNLTALDTSTTTNRRSYFHSDIAHQASSTARETFCAVIPTPSNFSPSTHAPNHTPRHTPHYMPHHTPAPHTPTPHLPSISPVIPPGPHSSTAQKPRNINDPISKPETSSRELRAKLLRAWSAGPSRPHPARRPPQGLRCGCGARGRRQGQGGNTRTTSTPGGRREACGAWAGLEIDHSER